MICQLPAPQAEQGVSDAPCRSGQYPSISAMAVITTKSHTRPPAVKTRAAASNKQSNVRPSGRGEGWRRKCGARFFHIVPVLVSFLVGGGVRGMRDWRSEAPDSVLFGSTLRALSASSTQLQGGGGGRKKGGFEGSEFRWMLGLGDGLRVVWDGSLGLLPELSSEFRCSENS